jgi:hypothetical protein
MFKGSIDMDLGSGAKRKDHSREDVAATQQIRHHAAKAAS